MRPLRFGTGGWRGLLGDEVTDARLRAVAHGAAGWLRRQPGAAVLVGFDRRFASERLAGVAAAVLQARGLDVWLARGPAPTPALARAVARRPALAGALVLTASHNPPHDHGCKLFGPRGEAVADAVARRVEAGAARALLREPRAAPRRGGLRRFDAAPPHARALLARAGGAGALRGVRLVYDAMHGCGAGVLDRALEAAGAQVERLRAEPDPTFGGAAPDPSPGRLQGLAAAVRAPDGPRLGLATDGDGDRLAAVDCDGRVLRDDEVAVLLLDHLARAGQLRRGLALGVACSSQLERVADAAGVPVTRHPVGFKHLAAQLIAGRADVAIDESGGFAWAPFGVDKDGMLAAMLLARRFAQEPASLRGALREIARRHGPVCAGRLALPADARVRRGLARLRARPPGRFDGVRVTGVTRSEGLHVALEDGFAMWRGSGTEPLVRVYAEARGPRRLARRLDACARALRRAGGADPSR